MNAEQLAQALGAVRSGRQWKCKCVSHEDRSPSMIIFDGRDSVQVRCMAGCEPADIIDVLKARGFWNADERGRTRRNSDEQSKPVSRETLSEQREQKMRVLARCTFDDALPLNGTAAERYFESRDLWSVAREIEDVRFHPRCPCEHSEQSAVVIAMRSIASRAVTGIQRIFLDRRGRKIGKGMMLGTCSGSAMQLQPKHGNTLHIAEGLETALAVIAHDYTPTWALGSTSLIQTFPVLDDIERLGIWADHDAEKLIGGRMCRPGEKAAFICAQRWLDAGKHAKVFEPTAEGDDAADRWVKLNARL